MDQERDAEHSLSKLFRWPGRESVAEEGSRELHKFPCVVIMNKSNNNNNNNMMIMKIMFDKLMNIIVVISNMFCGMSLDIYKLHQNSCSGMSLHSTHTMNSVNVIESPIKQRDPQKFTGF